MVSSQSPFYQGGYKQAVFAPFKLLIAFAVFLMVTLLSAWVAQYIFVYALWSGNATKLEWLLKTDAMQSLSGKGLAFFSTHAVDAAIAVYHLLFVKTSIEHMIVADPAALTSVDQGIQRLFHVVFPAANILFVGTKLYMIRLMLVFSTVPAILMAYIIGMVDGLAERAIRRYSGGRESASLYHRAKYLIAGLCGLSAIGYLCLPLEVAIEVIVIPVAITVVLLSRLQWKYYKKYL